MNIGKVVSSNNHVEYTVHIYNKNEITPAPTAKDHAFGTFVKINLNNSDSLIGVIYNTLLIDPEYGKAGPRLSTREEIKTFYPDYVDEKTKLIGVLILGYYNDNKPYHSIPPVAPDVGSEVITMTKKEIKDFHIISKKFRMGYFSLFNEFRPLLVKSLVLNIIHQLANLFPDKNPILEILRKDMEYKMKIEEGFSK
ncbi:MAG: hypothetical protein ACTSR3_06090 [Candidatus Helarchaeota archaeon]